MPVSFVPSTVRLLVLAVVPTTFLAGVAYAQEAGGPAPPTDGAPVDALETLVITGRQDLESVRDVPRSISVVSGTELERENAVNLDAITKRLANVKWNYGNSWTSNYSIRGVGKISTSHASDPSVGINVDGVPYGYNALASFNFFDVESVQVARGPQGTDYGKNATLGALRIVTKQPSFTPSSEYSLGFNQYEQQDYGNANGNVIATASITGPLIDNLLAYRTSLHVDKGGGYIVNRYNPDNSYISRDRVAGRIQLLATPTDNLMARLSVEIHPRNSENANVGSTNYFNTPTPTTYANGAPNPLSGDAVTRLSRRWFLQNADYTYAADYLSAEYVDSDSQQGLVTGTNGASLQIDWSLGDHFDITAITGWKDYYFNAFRDDEGNVFDVQTAAGSNIKYKQISQEIRVASQIGELVDYTAGLFLFESTNDVASNSIYGGDAGAWFASNSQYATLDANSDGRYLMENSLNVLWRQSGIQDVRSRSEAAFAQADWHLSDPLTLTTGARVSHESRTNTTGSRIEQQGYGRELNPVAVNGVQLGGFASAANGNLTPGANSAAQLAIADTVAQKYFNAPTYAALSAAQRAQVGAAKAIRAAQIGVLWNPVEAEEYTGTQPSWVISPRYRFNENLTTYLSYQHGEKAGVPQVINGVSALVAPEKSNAYELGVKSTLLNGNLLLNVAAFLNDITDYQQQVRVVDVYGTTLAQAADPNATTVYTTAAGNVPKVRVKGIEIDGVYNGIPYTQLRFAGAYNDARYRDSPNSAQPVENGNLPAPFQDVSGQALPGAAKWTFDVGAEYRKPVFDGKDFHASFNVAYNSRFNSDNALSSYAWVQSTTIADASIGIGSLGRAWDFTFYVKNLLDDDTKRNLTWNAYAPAIPRLYGITLAGRL
jgi:outer membrane receptor protein involved in Fe transport